MARFTAPIPSWAGSNSATLLDRRPGLHMTATADQDAGTCRRDDRSVERSGQFHVLAALSLTLIFGAAVVAGPVDIQELTFTGIPEIAAVDHCGPLTADADLSESR